MSGLFISHGPASAKVECSVCGRFGYQGGRWQEKCRAGHPHACPHCGKRYATKSQLAGHLRRTRG